MDEDPEWCTHDTSHTLKSICHHAWISWQNRFKTPPFLPLTLSTVLPLSMSLYLFLPQTISLFLHLLFPFLNLRGACVYSIFIILGGTVDRWDTCTITRAQHYLFQADRLKNTLSILSLTVSLFRKGGYYMKTSPILDRKYNPDLLTKSLSNLTILTTENISPCDNRKYNGLSISNHNFESICNKEESTGRTTRGKV